MSSHIHELWAELDLPELYPESDPVRVRARVDAALDGERAPVPVQTKPAANSGSGGPPAGRRAGPDGGLRPGGLPG